jgi:hypothetical protein
VGGLLAAPLTLNVSHWSAMTSSATRALLIDLTLFALWAWRARQPRFGTVLRD